MGDLVNVGLTAAYECLYETWIEMLPEPFVDFTEKAAEFKSPYPMTIYANAPDPTVLNVTLGRNLTQLELLQLQSARLFICLRVRFEYRDAFNRNRSAKMRVQNFGYMTNSPLGVGYLPKYNDSN